MPGGDGTGPSGQGGRRAGGRFGRGGVTSQGPGGQCRCPNCGYTQPHQLATPCYHRKCPKCGAPMTRE
jgi:uncharacterized protein